MNPKNSGLPGSSTQQLAAVRGDGDTHSSADPHPIYVGRCDLGAAVFAARDFATGESILTFDGPIISHGQTLAKGSDEANPLQIGVDRYLDLESPGVYLNHSCEPNVGIVQDKVVIALRPVKVGDELRFDYSTTMSDDGWTMQCRCKAPSCRGVVRAFEHLPCHLRQRYIQLGVVQHFLLERFAAGGDQHA